LEDLSDSIELYVDNEYDFLSIQVIDKDPVRAAAMANFMVDVLDLVNNELSAKTAGNFRKYVETRYEASEDSRAAMLDSLQAFQVRFGVYDLQAQTEAFFSQLAEMRVAAIQAEVQYEALRSQLGENNTTVQGLKEVVAASDRKYQAALAGRERVLPVPQDEVPNAVRAFLDIEMERTIQEKILEFVAPMLEQARFEEEQQKQAVQVVDAAVPPVKKDSPKRSVIVIAATMSAFILVVLYALVTAWWRANSTTFASRLREASEQAKG
jgi:capsule polysaccharide export protein KpsE/RkpR